MKLTRTIIVSFLGAFLLNVASVYAAQVTLAWDQNDPIPGGYRLFNRADNGQYDYNNPIWETPTAQEGLNTQPTQCTVTVPNELSHFVVRAYKDDLVSADSEEVAFDGALATQLTEPIKLRFRTTP